MPAHDRFVSVNGLRLRYREWGTHTAPPVFLLHGGSAHAHWWDRFAAALADAHHVFALDLRGHGDSEHPNPPAYRIADYAADLAAVIDALALPCVDLVGHSLGAMVATAYAGMAPRRIRTLVVVDSLLKITPAGARYLVRLRNFPQPEYRDREQAIRRFRLLPIHTTADPQLLAHIAACGFRELPDGRWTYKFDREALAFGEPQDLIPTLQQLTCPILLVRGAHSTLLTRSGLATLQAAADAEAIEIPDAHHHVMLDNPPAFENAVRGFLERAHVSPCRDREPLNP